MRNKKEFREKELGVVIFWRRRGDSVKLLKDWRKDWCEGIF